MHYKYIQIVTISEQTLDDQDKFHTESNTSLGHLFEIKMFTLKKKPKQKQKDNENNEFEEEQLDLDEKGYVDMKVQGVVCTNFDDTAAHSCKKLGPWGHSSFGWLR